MAEKRINYSADKINELLGKTDAMSVPDTLSDLTNDTGFISDIPSEYITETELNAKGYATQSFVTSAITNAELNGGSGGAVTYPTLSWESGKVTNATYPVGDIRRYGAKCDGDTDDAVALQWALDNCCPNGITVYLPEEKKIAIRTPIVLQATYEKNWGYKIKSNQLVTATFGIRQKCKDLFVGVNYGNSTSTFTKVRMYMDGINVQCDHSRGTIFKGLIINSSRIADCNFYNMYCVIEGSLAVGTRFIRNRVQGFEYAVLSSLCTLGDYTFDDVWNTFKNNSYSISALSNILTQNVTTSSDYSKYSVQSNDAFFMNNYIAGAQSQTWIPHTVFAYETIDNDFTVSHNWIEFVKYIVSPRLRRTGYTDSAVRGHRFSNNIFQNHHRFFNPMSRYTRYNIHDNGFYDFSKTGMDTAFKNHTDSDIDNLKNGVFVMDVNETYKAYYTDFNVNNNYFEANDYTIYLDSGNGGSYLSCRFEERDSKFYDNTNAPYVRLKNTDDLQKMNFTCFNKVESAVPTVTDTYTENSFVGRTVFVGGEMYVCIWTGSKIAYKKVTLS